MSRKLINQLREQANEIANEGHSGWGNTMSVAADHIELLEAETAVLNGTACAEEQAEGNNPCGVCKTCLKAHIAAVEFERDRLKMIVCKKLCRCSTEDNPPINPKEHGWCCPYRDVFE